MAPSDPIITAAPELRRRQDGANFMGWQYDSDLSQYESQTCDAGLSFYIGPTFVDCCPTTQTTCNPAIGCGAGSIIYTYPPAGNRTTTLTTAIPCTSQAGTSYPYCGTAFFFEYLGAPSPKTEYFCDVTSYKITMFRSKPAVAASTSSPSTRPSPSPSPAPSPSPSPSPTPTPHHTSKAWIAGAVIGPLLGLALIAALLFFCLGRRKKNRNNQAQVGGATMAPGQHHQPGQAPIGVGGYTDTKPPLSPAHNAQQPYDPQHGAFAPVSPTPPYAAPNQYVAPNSYAAPHSPPTQQMYPAQHNHTQPPHPSELG